MLGVLAKNNNRKTGKALQKNRINNDIRCREVRVLDADNELVGVMPTVDALRMAKEQGVDLVEISPNAEPPVCKLIEYGKYLYQKSKDQKSKKQKVVQVKEIKFRPGTDEGDYQVKLRSLIRFLEEGDKAKITLRFRGREMAHMSKTKYILDDFAEKLADIAAVDKPAKVEGRSIVLFLSAKR